MRIKVHGSVAIGRNRQRIGRVDRMEQVGRRRSRFDAFEDDARPAVAFDDGAGRADVREGRCPHEDSGARIVPDRVAVTLDPQARFALDADPSRTLIGHLHATIEFDDGEAVLAIDVDACAEAVERVAFGDAHITEHESAAPSKVDSTSTEAVFTGATLHPESPERRVDVAAQPHGRAVGGATVEARLAERGRRKRGAVGVATYELEHEVVAQALQHQVLGMHAIGDVIGDEDQVVAAEPVGALDRGADRRDGAVGSTPDHDGTCERRVRVRDQ